MQSGRPQQPRQTKQTIKSTDVPWETEEAMSEALFGSESGVDRGRASHLAAEWYRQNAAKVRPVRLGSF